jgi:hypothetical protein
MLQYIPVCTSTHIHLLVCSSMYEYELVWIGTYWYIPAFTVISYTLMPWYPVTRYITVQGSTMKYQKVLYPWITTVQQWTGMYFHQKVNRANQNQEETAAKASHSRTASKHKLRPMVTCSTAAPNMAQFFNGSGAMTTFIGILTANG